MHKKKINNHWLNPSFGYPSLAIFAGFSVEFSFGSSTTGVIEGVLGRFELNILADLR